MMITLDDVLTTSGKFKSRAGLATHDVKMNASVTAERASSLMLSFGRDRALTSGFRPQKVNASTPGAAKNSWHIYGCAIDIEDNDRELALFCLAEVKLLEHFGLWLEDPRWTRVKDQKTGKWSCWVHVQTKPPASGNRIFRPAGPMPR